MRKLIFLLLSCFCIHGAMCQSTTIQMTLKTIAPISSQSEEMEIPHLNCVVAHNVYLNGELLISENTPVDTRLDIYKARPRNRVGSVTIYFIGVNTNNGGRVFFNESYTKAGKLRKQRWMKGKNAYVPIGTMINVTGTYQKK